MTPDGLYKAIRAVPFEPFDVVTADGGRVPVRHPENIAYAGGRAAMVFTSESDWEVIEVALVTRLSMSRPAASPAAK